MAKWLEIFYVIRAAPADWDDVVDLDVVCCAAVEARAAESLENIGCYSQDDLPEAVTTL